MSWLLGALRQSDLAAFHFINRTLYLRSLADATYFMANDYILLGLLVAAGLVYLLWRGPRRGLVLLGWGGLAVLLSNLIHNLWLKPFFDRARPFLAVSDVHLNVGLRDLAAMSPSFPSTHAASAAALAIIATRLEPALAPWMGWFALIVGFCAIYSGGHYPLDVIAGYGVGVVLGWALSAGARTLWPAHLANGKTAAR